jgi:diguanylate cyclase (GGDEF)-like protein
MANEAALALENARLYEQVRHQAFHDPLTRLANRTLFRDRLEHALARTNRGLDQVAVLFVDLDDFKTVNDSLGHPAGDALLVAVGERLVGVLRPGDTVARLGGDEFAVLVEDVADHRDALAPAERILAAFAAPFSVAGSELFIGASVGIALGAAADRSADEVLRNADFAMYQAKSMGKRRYAVFEPGMRAAAVERVELAMLLRAAIDREELLLHYQPIVDLRTGVVRGLEALVRFPVSSSPSPRRPASSFRSAGGCSARRVVRPPSGTLVSRSIHRCRSASTSRRASSQTPAWSTRSPKPLPIRVSSRGA